MNLSDFVHVIVVVFILSLCFANIFYWYCKYKEMKDAFLYYIKNKNLPESFYNENK